jgi:hypothetical protein
MWKQRVTLTEVVPWHGRGHDREQQRREERVRERDAEHANDGVPRRERERAEARDAEQRRGERDGARAAVAVGHKAWGETAHLFTGCSLETRPGVGHIISARRDTC